MKFSLHLKIILLATSLVIFIGVGLSAVAFFKDRVSDLQLRMDVLKDTAKEAVFLSETPLYNLNIAELRRVVSAILLDQDITVAWVLDDQGRILTDGTVANPKRNSKPEINFISELMQAGEMGAVLESIDQDFHWASHPAVLADGTVLGYLVLGFPQSHLDDRLYLTLRNQLIVLVPALFFAIALATLFGRRIARVYDDKESLEVKVKKRTADLLEAKEIAEQADRAKSAFLSSMSHELRTPMNSILGFAQVLEMNRGGVLGKEQLGHVEQILAGGNHLLELIDQVLELNCIEAGRLALSFNEVDPRLILQKSLDMIKIRADKNQIKLIDLTEGHDLPPLWTDGTRLLQVLLNLLSNAVKYNIKNGSVTISCERTDTQMLRFNIRDTGVGIAVEKQKDLFMPFERLGRENGRIEGTGIGLTITKELIEVLGGNIGFESSDRERADRENQTNAGSLFWVDVPLNEV